jgi:hypothetical protein
MTIDQNGSVVPNTAPDASGHVGIANLNQGGGGKQDKFRRLNLRSQLADIATISPVPVPHDIPDDHLQVAAYYISQKDTSGSSPLAHWVKAIRQMRRHLVQQHAQRTSVA